jgi:hypothetical protein
MRFQAIAQRARQGHVDAVKILSNEGDIYTAEAMIQGETHVVETRHSDAPMVFHSYVEAKRELGHLGDLPIQLEQRELDDEMVGEE